jgi:hypothetical protein
MQVTNSMSILLHGASGPAEHRQSGQCPDGSDIPLPQPHDLILRQQAFEVTEFVPL